MSLSDTKESALGAYLRDRRTKLDPASFGLPLVRRRTPGLRREEVAQRANVSATWYTWLEQGRGGAPSADVLDRIARALMLTDAEREHLFILGLGRQPEVHIKEDESITPRLQRVVDAFEISPAMIKNAMWDVVAWNRAFATVLTDYGKLPPEKRNLLRVVFSDPQVRSVQYDWESVARFIVGVFRADVARIGATARVSALVDELCQSSPDFARLWRDNDVRNYGGGMKKLRHPVLGTVTFEYSAFAVDSRPDLGMIVYNPATPEDAERVKSLIRSAGG
ncbi:helix-turn-helix transcriptional regulator [Hyphomicrobium sp. DY-1]|uniref:helix-turn-helix transcriptional regulator n=1 Tax=Hyphomicrobium sp. DY-1 TaxID=3075650 RepID=UPI0039C34414